MRTRTRSWLLCGLVLSGALAAACGERTDDASRVDVAPHGEEAGTDDAPAPAAAAGPFADGADTPRFPPGEGPRFRGTVALGPEFSALDGEHTLWIIVRSKAGAGAPVAVQRVDRARFPLEYDVGAEHTTTQSDDSYEILKGELKVTARLSLSGGAIAAPGDLECEPAIMKGDDPPAALTLDRRRAP